MGVFAVKGEQLLTIDFLGNSALWKLFWVPVALHAIWDMPIEFGSSFYLVQFVLTLTAWIVIMVLINNSLAYIAKHVKSNQQQIQEQVVQETQRTNP